MPSPSSSPTWPRGRSCCSAPYLCSAVTIGTWPRPTPSKCSRRLRLAVRDSLAIIIVTYNSRQEIDACLQSLVGHTAPFPTTITVVDNQSTDGTAGYVREKWPSAVRVIDAGGNVGFARANNIGIRATDSEYVLLMNPDTEAPPGAIQTLVRGLASHPDAAIAGARLLGPTGFPELSWGPPLGPGNEFKRKVVSSLYHRKIPAIVRKVDKLSRQEREGPTVSGSDTVIRRDDHQP